MSAPGRLVASGSFRVDRARALKKLGAFALSDVDRFLIPWVRCADHCGTALVRLWRTGRAYEMRFGGRAFTRKELEDPFSCLFEDADDRRNDDLAVGLLSVLERGPRSVFGHGPRVTIVSGPPGQRYRLEVGAEYGERLFEVVAARSSETILRVERPWLSRAQGRRPIDLLREACDNPFRGFGLDIDGGRTLLPPARPAKEALVRGPLRFLFKLADQRDSRVRFHLGGVRVDTVPTVLNWLQVDADVECPRFRLDASQNAVVRDDLYHSVFTTLSRLALERAAWTFHQASGYYARSLGNPNPAPELPRPSEPLRSLPFSLASLARLRRACAPALATGSRDPALEPLRRQFFFLDSRGMPAHLPKLLALPKGTMPELQAHNQDDGFALRTLLPRRL
ncbi:MAG: hypothetical protein HY553_17930 [Elusimicrobia bacterium]|nr:hypothetical protein [Elusimicrobiota bacterium]